ncbi:unnamed protein product, partial [Owenia fusiformis]
SEAVSAKAKSRPKEGSVADLDSDAGRSKERSKVKKQLLSSKQRTSKSWHQMIGIVCWKGYVADTEDDTPSPTKYRRRRRYTLQQKRKLVSLNSCIAATSISNFLQKSRTYFFVKLFLFLEIISVQL